MVRYNAHIVVVEGGDAVYVATFLAFPRICDKKMGVIDQLKSSGVAMRNLFTDLQECQGSLVDVFGVAFPLRPPYLSRV